MNDRLAELKRGAAAPEQVSINIETENQTGKSLTIRQDKVICLRAINIQVGLVRSNGNANNAGKGSVSEEMRTFFSDVELVKKNIVVIKQAAKRIGDINQQVFI